MIRNQWYVILESKEVKAKPVGVTRCGEKLVLYRNPKGKLICLMDKCAHRGVALSAGKVVHGNIQCPFHGLQYDQTGKCVLIPANGTHTPIPKRFKVHQYYVKEANDFIWLWWGEPQENYPKLPFFEDIGKKFMFSSFRDHWKVHYSRAIENQLDVVHLPFVHHNTIGRGNYTLINGPLVDVINDEINVWVYNEKNRGQIPKTPKEIEKPNQRAMLHFRFPNIWQNFLAEKMRVMLAFAPIDDENSMIYMRYYQAMITIPLLGHFICWFGKVFSIWILRQDKRVVQTQIPKKTWLKMGEQLIQGDLPIIRYRRIREELKKNHKAS